MEQVHILIRNITQVKPTNLDYLKDQARPKKMKLQTLEPSNFRLILVISFHSFLYETKNSHGNNFDDNDDIILSIYSGSSI